MSMIGGNCPIAVLNVPRRDVLLIPYATSINVALTGNLSFPSPDPPLSILAADIGAYQTAQAVAAKKALGAAKLRGAKKRKVIADLNHLRDYVQSIAEIQASVGDAAAVIVSAGMRVKLVGKHVKAALTATNGVVSGQALLDARAVADFAIYYWQYSLDQKVWINAPETIQAHTVISGLTPAQTYYFRFHATLRKTVVDFSQVVSLLVH